MEHKLIKGDTKRYMQADMDSKDGDYITWKTLARCPKCRERLVATAKELFCEKCGWREAK